MNIYKLIILALFLSGCATNPFEKEICSGFSDWLDRPLEEGEERSVSFDWDSSEDHIPFYANMRTNGQINNAEKDLYSDVSQSTHYIHLKEYTKIVAKCFGLRQQLDTQNKLVYDKNQKGINISAVWVSTYCSTEILNGSGCFSLTQSNK